MYGNRPGLKTFSLVILWAVFPAAWGVSPGEQIRPQFPRASTSECFSEEPVSRQSGLFAHTVYMTTTENGLKFPDLKGRRIIPHASVPEGVTGPDGNLWVYFVNGIRGRHGIFAARRRWDERWETIGCVRLDGKFDGNAVDPDIVRLPDGRYRLYYYRGRFIDPGPPPPPQEPHPIYSAVSVDGLNFSVEGIVFSEPGVTDPSVVQLPGGTWLMALAAPQGVIFASSPDGLSFQATGVELPPNGIPELAVLPNGQLTLYLRQVYFSYDGGGSWVVQPDITIPGHSMSSLAALPTGGFAFFWVELENS